MKTILHRFRSSGSCYFVELASHHRGDLPLLVDLQPISPSFCGLHPHSSPQTTASGSCRLFRSSSCCSADLQTIRRPMTPYQHLASGHLMSYPNSIRATGDSNCRWCATTSTMRHHHSIAFWLPYLHHHHPATSVLSLHL